MIPAEPAYRVDDPIHLPQLHAVHQAIEFIEVLIYLLVIIWIAFIMAFVKYGQHRLTIPIIGWLRLDISLRFLKKGIHR